MASDRTLVKAPAPPQPDDRAGRIFRHRLGRGSRPPRDTARIASRRPLPTPPTDQEKYSYVHRELPLLILMSIVSISCLTISQVHFIQLSPWLWLLVPFLGFTIMYYLISLRVNLTSRNFDISRHHRLVASAQPKTHPSVDIWLPICGEPADVLANTWRHVCALAAAYPGPIALYVLDDGDSPAARRLAENMGLKYLVRPNRGWFKKAGNLRHGFENSTGEYIAVFDADFAPRVDFLHNLLPHLVDDPELGIVQSPQYFRVSRRQSWMERGAGAVQELFYRVVQVSRDRLGGAICVGSCAVYRRAALETIGGTALIEHSEDVHTGFELKRAGWGLRYVPLPMATGLCPEDPDSFLTQQYRWCAGSMSLLMSEKFWKAKMQPSTRLCFISGFCYYLHTAVFTFLTPVIPILLIVLMPGQVRLVNYLWILPSTAYNLVVFPLWNRCGYGLTALMARSLYGWAHFFAIFDIMCNKQMGWQTTGASGGKTQTRRMWLVLGAWSSVTSVLWVGSATLRMVQISAASFAFLFATGVLYTVIVAMPFVARRKMSREITVP